MTRRCICLGCALHDGVCRTTVTRGRCRSCGNRREQTRRPHWRERYGPDHESRRETVIGGPCELRLPGCTGIATTLEHDIPVSQGGRDGPIRGACAHCNAARGARPR